TYLRKLAAAGTLSRAQIFPAVHNAATGDPRTRYGDPGLRPWFVAFDGDATAYVTGGIDTSWYDTNHYLLVMTDAQSVPPAVPAGDAGAAHAPAAKLRGHAARRRQAAGGPVRRADVRRDLVAVGRTGTGVRPDAGAGRAAQEGTGGAGRTARPPGTGGPGVVPPPGPDGRPDPG